MKTHTKSLTLATCLALTLGGLCSLHAQDAQPGGRRGGGAGFGMRGPGFDSLSQEEKDKLKAASEKAQQDAKVREAREKMEASMKDFRDAMAAAEIAADPSVEPILKKLQEARDKAQKDGAGRKPAGDAAK
ncbi:MAG: periplasmic heavy metal sensor [Chthoniobacter sp.]|nr:periplasmic heavy metal sensor [Chthoniobacter sp.]